MKKKLFILIIGVIFLFVISMFLFNQKDSGFEDESQLEDCNHLRDIFDETVERNKLSIIENSSALCYGLDMSSNFLELEEIHAVATLEKIEDDKLFFKGGTESFSFMLLPRTNFSDYEIGESYLLDMNNICRQFFILADSRMPSPIIETLKEPEKIICKN